MFSQLKETYSYFLLQSKLMFDSEDISCFESFWLYYLALGHLYEIYIHILHCTLFLCSYFIYITSQNCCLFQNYFDQVPWQYHHSSIQITILARPTRNLVVHTFAYLLAHKIISNYQWQWLYNDRSSWIVSLDVILIQNLFSLTITCSKEITNRPGRK